MEFFRFLLAAAIWWAISSTADWIESKMPPKGYHALCWVMLLPLALLGYITAPMLVSLGVFWPVLSFPAFVGIGMVTAPNYRRWIPGIFLLGFVALIAAREIADGWKLGNTRSWLAAGGGIVLSLATFWKLRFGDRELTKDEQRANLLAALGHEPDGSTTQR